MTLLAVLFQCTTIHIHICVIADKQLLKFHARCKFCHYMPKRYGIKLWLIFSAEICCLGRIQPYFGKGSVASQKLKSRRKSRFRFDLWSKRV